MDKRYHAVIIKSKNIRSIKKAIHGEKLCGPVIHVLGDWHMFALKENAPEKAKVLSAILSTSVFYFFDLSNYSWRYILYDKGKELYSLQADHFVDRQQMPELFLGQPVVRISPDEAKEDFLALHQVCKHYVLPKDKECSIIKGHYVDYLV
ncbi:MAG: hypothetical protein ACYCX4_15615 [Bacillota bacterium]